MQELAIQAVAKRKYKATTDSAHSKSVAENHLNRNFTPDKPKVSWVADITYTIPRKAGSIWPPSWIFTPVRLSADLQGKD